MLQSHFHASGFAARIWLAKTVRTPFFIAACVFLLALSYSLHVRKSIAKQAEQIAAGQPYCILVPSGNSSKPVDNFFDTMGLIMLGNSGTNHARLVVGYKENATHYHWSYFNHKFINEADSFGGGCAKNKFDYDRLQSEDYLEKRTLLAHSKKYEIPIVFQPSFGGNSIGFVAQIPNFKPIKELCSKHKCNMIHVSSNNGVLLDIPESAKRLSKRNPLQISGTYYSTNRSAEVTTAIYCLDADIQCLVKFDRDDLQYSFHIMPKDLHQLKDIEDQIVEFVNSFTK